jgi:hypothetical protein
MDFYYSLVGDEWQTDKVPHTSNDQRKKKKKK